MGQVALQPFTICASRGLSETEVRGCAVAGAEALRKICPTVHSRYSRKSATVSRLNRPVIKACQPKLWGGYRQPAFAKATAANLRLSREQRLACQPKLVADRDSPPPPRLRWASFAWTASEGWWRRRDSDLLNPLRVKNLQQSTSYRFRRSHRMATEKYKTGTAIRAADLIRAAGVSPSKRGSIARLPSSDEISPVPGPSPIRCRPQRRQGHHSRSRT